MWAPHMFSVVLTDEPLELGKPGLGHQRTVQESSDSKGLQTAANIWVTFPVPLILGWPKLFTDGQIFIICKWIKNCHFLSFEALFNTPGSSLKYHRATPTYTLFVVWYSILDISNFETRKLCLAQFFERVFREFSESFREFSVFCMAYLLLFCIYFNELLL